MDHTFDVRAICNTCRFCKQWNIDKKKLSHDLLCLSVATANISLTRLLLLIYETVKYRFICCLIRFGVYTT